MHIIIFFKSPNEDWKWNYKLRLTLLEGILKANNNCNLRVYNSVYVIIKKFKRLNKVIKGRKKYLIPYKTYVIATIMKSKKLLNEEKLKNLRSAELIYLRIQLFKDYITVRVHKVKEIYTKSL